jgi:Ca2+-transporting ATPase
LFAGGVSRQATAARQRYARANAELAEQGSGCRLRGAGFSRRRREGAGDPKDLLNRIVLVALVVDPPRPEAKQAIAQCPQAGIRVRMITGDHPVTRDSIPSHWLMTRLAVDDVAASVEASGDRSPSC